MGLRPAWFLTSVLALVLWIAPAGSEGLGASHWADASGAEQDAVVVEEAAADPAPPTADEAPSEPTSEPTPPVTGEEAPLTIQEQLSPEGSLPDPDDAIQLRLKLDTIDLEKLYESVRAHAERETLRLSLEQCIQLGLEQNRDIIISEFEPEQAASDTMSAKGEFDPVLSGNVSYTEAQQSVSAETVTFGGIPNVELFRTTGSTSLAGKLGWGTTYELSLDVDKEETTYNRFIEEWSGTLTLSVTQPLLRGRGTSANLARIRVARLSEQQAGEQVLLQVMTSVADVIKAYWDLVGAVETVKVQEESLANAERLLNTNERRYEIGTAAALEVVQAKAGVATRQSDLISARSQVLDAADRLKNFISMGDDGYLSPVRIVPTGRPSLSDVSLDADASIETALENRPEMLTAKLAIDSAEVERKRAANDMLPQLDVAGSVSQGGRGHYPSDVFDGVRERSDNSYTVGIQGSVPITNRAARGAYQRTYLEKRKAEQRLLRTKQDVITNVRIALRNVATSRILVESNKQTRALQETNLLAEEKRLRLGLTTSFEVLRVEEDLTAAQTQEVQSIINWEKALVDLRLAEGVLLSELGITYEPRDFANPVGFLRTLWPVAVKDNGGL